MNGAVGTSVSFDFDLHPLMTRGRGLIPSLCNKHVHLERLAQCPVAEDRQETADLAALETPEGVASLPAPLRFRAEETERSARWRPPRPGTLADRSPEGTVHRFSPEGAGPQKPWAIGIRTF